MRLGAVVVGRAETEGPEVMSVPSNACCNRVMGRRSGSLPRTAPCIAGRSSSSSSARSIVVSRGLSAGEKVVTAGVNSLAEGQPVKPEMEGKSGVNSLAEASR